MLSFDLVTPFDVFYAYDHELYPHLLYLLSRRLMGGKSLCLVGVFLQIAGGISRRDLKGSHRFEDHQAVKDFNEDYGRSESLKGAMLSSLQEGGARGTQSRGT